VAQVAVCSQIHAKHTTAWSSAFGPGRADYDQQHRYHHAPTVKSEATTAVVEFLMMGV